VRTKGFCGQSKGGAFLFPSGHSRKGKKTGKGGKRGKVKPSGDRIDHASEGVVWIGKNADQ